MKHKHWIGLGLISLALVSSGIAIVGCGKAESGNGGASGTTQQYTCSMHPEVVQNSPGKCPKCGMELVVKK